MDPNFLFSALVQILLLWLAVSLHESAHAWTAGRCGDPTARDLGRVSLNPLRHFDLLGSWLFPALLLTFGWPLFGWGRSTPVLSQNLRRPGRDDLLVPIIFTLVRLAFINVGMAAFNLIPLPPLDGGQIALHLLPPDWAARLAAVRPYGFMIGVLAAVGLVPLLTFILGMVINFS
jgi:Zn-dependent protease